MYFAKCFHTLYIEANDLSVFDEAALQKVVAMVAQESQALLEIVNLNIEGEQYVCAGQVN